MYVYKDISQNRFLVTVKIDSRSPILRNRLFDSIWHISYVTYHMSHMIFRQFFPEICHQQKRHQFE